ncbi:hypothetical protein, partial [Limosilactobacillus fermentum]|uniref:hypothetical protein n=1 Tax=Limosilactobacillus fermentum TaxID=1613 RepID=UPI001CD8F926
ASSAATDWYKRQTLRIPLFQAKEMTLPQQNTALARPTSFYYLMCQLDRVQYRTSRISSFPLKEMTKPWRNITTIWLDKKNCVFVFISVNLTGDSTLEMTLLLFKVSTLRGIVRQQP